MSQSNQNSTQDEPKEDAKVQVPSAGPLLETPGNEDPDLPMLDSQSYRPYSSQLMHSNQSMQSAPFHLTTETLPSDAGSSGSEGALNQPAAAPQANFARQANELINASLGRTPDGMSVIDPDSVLDESGRLYHGYKDGKYFLPNDAAEQDRLDLQHHLFNLVLDGWLALAPMKTVPEHVLDVATGTGIWAIEFAERYPDSTVIGTDLSAIQPDRGLSNCSFQKDDAEAEWVFRADGKPDGILFDYVHLRLVMSCFDDTQLVMRHAFNNMNPGGWIEFQDMIIESSHRRNLNSPLARWWDDCCRGARTIGRDTEKPLQYKAWLEEIGFTDIRERKILVPASPWPKDRKFKEIGLFSLQNLLQGLKPIGWKFLKLAGYTPEAIEALVSEAHEYLRDVRNQPVTTVYVIYARKPLPDDPMDLVSPEAPEEL